MNTHSDWVTSKTDRNIQVLDDDAQEGQDGSCSGRTSGRGGLAALNRASSARRCRSIVGRGCGDGKDSERRDDGELGEHCV